MFVTAQNVESKVLHDELACGGDQAIRHLWESHGGAPNFKFDSVRGSDRERAQLVTDFAHTMIKNGIYQNEHLRFQGNQVAEAFGVLRALYMQSDHYRLDGSGRVLERALDKVQELTESHPDSVVVAYLLQTAATGLMYGDW